MARRLPVHPRVRVYEAVRTAHLERFAELEPASVLYAARNYDFDESLVDQLDVIQYDGPRDLFARLFRSDVVELEINEPLMLSAVKHALVAVLAVRVRGLLSRRRTRVVSYAIGNEDPFATKSPRLRSWWRRRLFRVAVGLLTRQVDRLAYGTPGAQAEYAPWIRGRRDGVRLIPALPTVCETCPPPSDELSVEVAFLGAFDERKGLRQLVEAWPQVVQTLPAAELHVLGKGPLEDLARAAAHHQSRVSLSVDPSRALIHEVLRRAKVLVLLSQPSGTWREQVGLPIVEALSHGCEIVTTTETGIADWLAEHGHQVLEPRTSDAAAVAAAVVRALRAARPASEVIADLPPVDGRLAADRWLFSVGQ